MMQNDDSELAAFEERVSEVADLVARLKAGEDIQEEDVSRIETPEQVEERRRAEETKRYLDEKKGWWERAEVLQGRSKEDAKAERMAILDALRNKKPRRKQDAKPEERIIITDDNGEVLFPKPKRNVDALDYSVWEKWIPDDPVSLEEMQKAKDGIEEVRNTEFEKANPDFCAQFREDLEKREKSRNEKEKKAEKLRRKGNKFFKEEKYDAALRNYQQALDLTPWGIPLLGNIAQVHLILGTYDRTHDFCERILFFDAENVKALWRKSRAYLECGNFAEAVADLSLASMLSPEDEQIDQALTKARGEFMEGLAEKQIETCSDEKFNLEIISGDANIQIAIVRRMCSAICGADLIEDSKEAKLAVSGLIEMFTARASEEDAAALRVLFRNSGALQKCIDSVKDDLASEEIFQLIVHSCMNSVKNFQIFTEANLFRVMMNEGRQEELITFAAIATPFSEFCTFLLKKDEEIHAILTNGLADGSAKTFTRTSSILRCVSSTKHGRNIICQLIPSFCNVLLRQMPQADSKGYEDAAAVLVNITSDKDWDCTLDTAALVDCLKKRNESSTSQARGFILTVFINLKKPLKDEEVLQMIEQWIFDKEQDASIRVHSATLIGRQVDSSRISASVDDFLELCNAEPSLKKPAVRCIGALLARKAPSIPVQHILAFLAKELAEQVSSFETLPSCADDGYAGNLAVVLKRVFDHSNVKSCKWIDSIARSIVKIVQLSEDGPGRSNAAIALARIATSCPGNRALVTELGGMRMLVELGNRIVPKKQNINT